MAERHSNPSSEMTARGCSRPVRYERSDFRWDHNDRYLSNDGKGPMMARILCATDKIVKLERWNMKSKNPRKKSGTLSIKFFTSDRCGWKKTSRK